MSVYEYQGCYNDESSVASGGEGRAMTNISSDGTVSGCADACESYEYFAIQDADQCFCGNDWDAITKYGIYDGSGWNKYNRTNCSKSDSHWIGGWWTNAIYQFSLCYIFITIYFVYSILTHILSAGNATSLKYIANK